MHVRCGFEAGSVEENTQTMINAIENYPINVVAHAGNPLFPMDYDLLAEKAKQNDVAIEFNNSSYLSTTSRSGAYDLDIKLAEAVKKYKNKVSLGSDAHISTLVGNFDKALELVETTNIEKKQIINYSLEDIENLIKK